MDVTSSFLGISCSRYIYLGLSTTPGAHLGMGYRPGMASASAIGQLQSAQWRFIWGGVMAISLLILNGKE